MNIEQIEARNRAVGEEFFDASVIEFFNSIIYPTVYADRYFITSEQMNGAPRNCPRYYTVREVLDDGRIIRVDKDHKYQTHNQAQAAAKQLAKD